MAINVANFTPSTNYIIAASTTSTNQALTQPTASVGNRDIQFFNASGSVAFAKWGTVAQTATNADYAIAPGAIQMIRMGADYNNLAVILETGTGNIYVSLGNGA